jgi:nitroimidazol reductase NimA-like FMN-containing flavoprotein (pyridoxamine 5'-phosphate oxidase superfamily)
MPPGGRSDVDRQEETRQLLKELLTSQRFAVLSTQSGTGPYASLIAFWAAADLSHLVFATMRATRKFNNLVTHPQVALLFDSRSNRDVDVREAMAVTATGTARELTDETARAAASKQFLAKHPHLTSFVASPGCAFVRVVVDTYYVVTHFQSVVELHMPGSGHAG